MYKRDKLFMVVLIGPAGAGKTTLAKFLKDKITNTAHASSDNIKRFISQFKEVSSHNKVSRNVTNAMIEEYLKNGISVIVDQNMSEEEVKKLRGIADKNNVDFFLYRIEAHKDIRTQRVAERTQKSNKSMTSEKTMDKLSKRYEENLYPGNATFNSGKLSEGEMADLIMKDLKTIEL